ncbi:transposase [Streptomyces sp. NPDC049541]|uniref:transposase n=1 Tax=Streptomyces sp. NPDC049541 TaxID=3365594 RepID=UPI0037AD7879
MRWASLPADFPTWRAVYRFFRRWRDNGLVKELDISKRGERPPPLYLEEPQTSRSGDRRG